jgi:DNA-3-methyladenine glycosylase
MTQKRIRLGIDFYQRDVLVVAKDLLGQLIVRNIDGEVKNAIITETEAYRGEEDLACHARFGRTKRTQMLYDRAGLVYVYLIYGMYWLINVVTGDEDQPQAVLLRGIYDQDNQTQITGSGKVGRWLKVDKSFYGEDLVASNRIWFETRVGEKPKVESKERVGVDYAGEWAKKKWRFFMRR